MQFNDTSTRKGLIQDCEFWTGIGDGQISGITANLQHFTRLINSRYQQVVTMILDSMDEWDFDDNNKTDFPILTTSLVASQQDYALPVTALKLKRVEVSYDGGTTWARANPIDINEMSHPTDTTSIAGHFSTAAPYYDVQYGSLFLYPIPSANSTNGLKMWVTREVTEFTTSDTTLEPGFDEPFHRMLAIGAALDWAIAKQLENKKDLASLYMEYEARLRPYYSAKNKDRKYVLKPAYVNYN